MALCRELLLAVAGLSSYVTAFRPAFRSPLPHRGRGRRRLIAWTGINIVQVVKHRAGAALTIQCRIVYGCQASVTRLVTISQGSGGINTAYIERLNATFRQRLACLAHRSRQLVQQQASLQAGMFLVGTVYNFCTDHHSLRIRLWMTERQYRWVQRTPAMAAHLTVDTQAYPAAIHFLEGAFGFTVIERPISMGANLTDFQIPSEILELELKRQQEDDLWIKPVTSADLPDLMPFVAAYFGWDWYRHLQEYLLEYFGDSSSQICVLVARLRGEVVGFCPQRHERFGPFGVRPDARNLGIGRILLFRCLAEMSARHIYYSYFMWTGDDAARLYTQAGYKQRRTFAILRKEL